MANGAHSRFRGSVELVSKLRQKAELRVRAGTAYVLAHSVAANINIFRECADGQ